MPRVATCKACGTRFQVPDSTTALRAKCKKCGGVVEIPPPEGGRAAPAAGRPDPQTSPVPTGPAVSAAAPTRGTRAGARPRGDAAAPVEKRPRGRRRDESKREGGRAARGKEPLGKGAIAGAVLVVVLLIVGGYFVFWGDATPPVAAAPTAASVAAPTSSPVEASASASTPRAPIPAATPSALDPSATGGDPASDPDLAGVEKAPAARSAVEVPEEPMPTRLEFEPLPPIAGTSPEQLAEWTDLLRELFITDGGATARRRGKLQTQLEAVDPIDAIPAYLNALNGVDLAEATGVIGTFNLVSNWQERVAYTPRFAFPGDVNRMDTLTQNKRVIAVRDQWLESWWVGQYAKGANAQRLADYRLKVEDARRARAQGKDAPPDEDEEGE